MEYKIVRDYKTSLNEIENQLEYLQNEKELLQYVKIKSVKLRNKFTKKEQVIHDLYFAAFGASSDSPKWIRAIKKGDTIYVLHDDFTHYNMGTGDGEYSVVGIDDEPVTLIFRNFCNRVTADHIYQDKDAAEKILKGHLSEGNPNDSYRSIDSIEIDKKAYPLFTCREGMFLSNKSSLNQVVTRSITTKTASEEQLKDLMDIQKALKEDSNKCYAYVAYSNQLKLNFSYQLIDKKDLKSGKYVVSNYYKTYTAEDIDSNDVIDKIDYDVLCIGLGSAGSNIMEQFARLNYFEKYMLVDPDEVEARNLRNQIYRNNQIGEYKVRAADYILREYNVKCPSINTFVYKFEEQSYDLYKFKYVISGLDSIDTRIELLDYIESGKIETKYLIDARYIDLDSSLYIIDMSNKEEVEYYKKLLLEDKKELETIKAKQEEQKEAEWIPWTTDEIKESRLFKQIVGGHCSKNTEKYQGTKSRNLCNVFDMHIRCGSTECAELWQEYYNKSKIPHDEESTCLAQNIVHIYKLTSAWVVSAVRSIETDNKKPFTHVEITAEPIPNAIVLKK